MRPSITEQLDGMARIVRDVLGAHLDDAYANDIATGVAVTLSTLGASWQEVPAFQRWETGEIESLLREALPHLDASLAADVAGLERGAAAGADPLDLRALDARHTVARDLLARAVPLIESDPALGAVRDGLHALARDRIARYPLVAPRPRS